MSERFLVYCAGDHCINGFELDASSHPYLISRYRLPDAEGRNGSAPMVLSPDGRFLYAAFRGMPYRVYVFAVDSREAGLQLIGIRPLPADMCHINLDRTGSYLLGASFTGGVVAVCQMDGDGLPGIARTLETPPNPHFVTVTGDNRRLLVTSLGADAVLAYRFDETDSSLVQIGLLQLVPGSGPRHLAKSSIAGQWYVISETAGTVTMFTENEGAGFSVAPPMSILETPPKTSKASDIWISPNGKTLYAAERNVGRIGVFDISQLGQPVRLGDIETTPFPRVLTTNASGRLLMVASEKSSLLAIHPVEKRSGMPQPPKFYSIGSRPTWITVLPQT
jgi:6-phosphogluconolactonase